MTVSDAKRLKRLVDENVRLRKVPVERDLEVDALKSWLAERLEWMDGAPGS